MKNNLAVKGDGFFIAKNYFDDPAGYVRDVLKVDPDQWQKDVLQAIVDNDRVAVASGHGIGKTALTSFLIHWFIATRPNPQIVVTANTQQQLATKTWRELSKWNQKALNGEWFKWTATRFSLVGAEETWSAHAIPWSENNSEAFAGTHEENVLIVFDEASAIPDVIWEVCEGAMTTEGAKWAAFGNPTRNTGRFHACFNRYRHRWFNMQIDSRSARMTDKEQIQEWIDDYGEDSDFVRVRVRGVFPRAGDTQFIPADLVETAVKNEAYVPHGTPKLMGVDVARFGSDQSVIAMRHGRKLEPLLKYRELDTMALASLVADKINEFSPDAVFVDGVGVGSGVVDRLRQLGFDIIEVISGKSPDEGNKDKYANKRAEMWDRMKHWLEGADIPDDKDLVADLMSPEYGFNARMKLQLEKKEDMKKRGLASPDCADAVALTFAYPVAPKAVERSIEPEIVNYY
jgi:hypothetical protein